MEERERIQRWNDKEDLIDEVRAVLGVEPHGLRRAIAMLSHPEIIQHTIRYFSELDDSHICIKYEEPWNCAKVSEVNYESVTPHWIASEQTVVIGGDWCQPCRDRALNKQ